MEYQVGDLVEFKYSSAGSTINDATRTIFLIKKLDKYKWRAELLNDSMGNYNTLDDVFYLKDWQEGVKLIWRKNSS